MYGDKSHRRAWNKSESPYHTHFLALFLIGLLLHYEKVKRSTETTGVSTVVCEHAQVKNREGR